MGQLVLSSLSTPIHSSITSELGLLPHNHIGVISSVEPRSSLSWDQQPRLKRVLTHEILEGMGWDSKEVGEIEPRLELSGPASIT